MHVLCAFEQSSARARVGRDDRPPDQSRLARAMIFHCRRRQCVDDSTVLMSELAELETVASKSLLF
ncbi:hypothetical protein Tdes44962_MAKER04197 [Teratosphaeria destructans]|uniref:Uncharacterized protein n=1 Tax=Teratosphaeria destructans TaxID=418781 RepID=A0A9W7SN58_9PEZI|nr:hypothetical protein Tdes44962_MAKER04197 [Teratosphaeria destructans]